MHSVLEQKVMNDLLLDESVRRVSKGIKGQSLKESLNEDNPIIPCSRRESVRSINTGWPI